MVEEISDKRLYIKRERKRALVRVCLCALLQYKALDAVLYMRPYLATRMAQIRLRIFAI